MKVMELKKYWIVFWRLKKIGLMNRAAYKANFYVLLFAVFLRTFFNLFFIKVIFSFINTIAGWGYFEALIIVGTINIIDGFMWVLFGNMKALPTHIINGTLDGILVRPIDSQFLVSSWRGDAEDIVRVITGMSIIIYALSNLNIMGMALIINLFLYGFMLLNAIVIIYSILLMIKIIVFWVVDGQSLFFMEEKILEMSQYPTDIFYHNIIKLLFSTLLPLAFMATVPAKILTTGFDLKLFIGSFLVAITFFILSRKLFKFGLSNYSSASS